MSDHGDGSFGFERLEVWRKAMTFAGVVYRLTKTFPKEELFGLTMQIRRASVSVAANIAEGASRSTGKDQARFFEIAYGFLNEIMTLLFISAEQGLVAQEQLNNAKKQVSDMCRMLSGLKHSALSGITDSLNTQHSTLNKKTSGGGQA